MVYRIALQHPKHGASAKFFLSYTIVKVLLPAVWVRITFNPKPQPFTAFAQGSPFKGLGVLLDFSPGSQPCLGFKGFYGLRFSV